MGLLAQTVFALVLVLPLGCTEPPVPLPPTAPIPPPRPTAVASAAPVFAPTPMPRRIALTDTYGCAVRNDGAVACWGDDIDGSSYDKPLVLRHDKRAVGVSIVEKRRCVLFEEGSGKCWGKDDIELPFDKMVALVAAGHRVCAIDPTGNVACNGLRDRWERGALLAGGSFGCVATADFGLSCWGGPVEINEPGIHQGWPSGPVPRQPLMVRGVTQIAVDRKRACVRTVEGAVSCYGEHGARHHIPELQGAHDIGAGGGSICGAIGDRVVCDGSIVKALSQRGGESEVTIAGVAQVATVSRNACAITNAGVVHCWGYVGNANLGPASRETVLGAFQVPKLDRVVQLSAGAEHACARRDDGTVWCWRQGEPTRIQGVRDAIDIESSGDDNCAVVKGGKLACWRRTEPAGAINTVAGARTITLFPPCVFFAGDRLACWEFPEHILEGKQPKPLPGIARAQDIDEDGQGVARCAIVSGRVRCLLRKGHSTEDNGPITRGILPIGGVSRAEKIRIDHDVHNHSTAVCVLAAGAVSCSLLPNSDGVVLRQHTGFSIDPRAASDIVDFDISNASYAIDTGGSVREIEGRSGVPIPAIDDAVEVAAGGQFGCVRRKGGTVACWSEAPELARQHTVGGRPYAISPVVVKLD